jgi:hypothetical protein
MVGYTETGLWEGGKDDEDSRGIRSLNRRYPNCAREAVPLDSMIFAWEILPKAIAAGKQQPTRGDQSELWPNYT